MGGRGSFCPSLRVASYPNVVSSSAVWRHSALVTDIG